MTKFDGQPALTVVQAGKNKYYAGKENNTMS
jgi:hypothetical protein